MKHSKNNLETFLKHLCENLETHTCEIKILTCPTLRQSLDEIVNLAVTCITAKYFPHNSPTDRFCHPDANETMI